MGKKGIKERREPKRDDAKREGAAKVKHNATRTPYEMLGVARDATEAEIKKAYRTLALSTHPDKSSDLDAAEKFQKLQKVYETLIDKEKRAIYDETGVIVGDDGDDLFSRGVNAEDAYAYYRELFGQLVQEDIDAYEEKYRYGGMEKEDLVTFYHRFHGELKDILAYIPFSEECDLARFLDFYEEKIEVGALKETEKFRTSRAGLLQVAKAHLRREDIRPKKKKRKQSSRSLVNGSNSKALQDKGPADGGTEEADDSSSLAALIRRKQSRREDQFDDFVEHLAAKYGDASKKLRSKALPKQKSRPK